MKSKLTITVDADLIPAAKRFARSQGVTLSSLVEKALREATEKPEPSFSERWRGNSNRRARSRRSRSAGARNWRMRLASIRRSRAKPRVSTALPGSTCRDASRHEHLGGRGSGNHIPRQRWNF